MNAPAMTPQQQRLTDERQSAFSLYREIAVGAESWGHFAWFELCTLLASNVPGALGLGLRALLFPSLFAQWRGGAALGRGLVIRNPRKIRVGKKVLVDDGAVLDARGEGAQLTLGDFVSIGRYSTLAAKGGTISLGAGVNVGSYCRLATQSKIEIGESTLIAAYAYIGPGNHQRGDGDVPLIAREMDIRGGVTIGAQAWIGTRATILDGVSIGEGAIVGAHSLVVEDVPAGAVVAGTPARIIKHAGAHG
jgi:acetyltransferase-like isoleucine patch superfamily enzyme